MTPTRQGSFHIFRFKGIDVYLHWSWFLIAFYQITTARQDDYSSPLWRVFEYLSLFLIVLMHEFGHSLACRQVGGVADQIVLWPLGGVAYVNPPQRPGATLWSIAAGPLVNVALVPIFWGITVWGASANWAQRMPDLDLFFKNLAFINTWLLILNLMPVYPLDGGQILRSLLWFPLGRVRSLLVATVIGFIGAAFVGWWLLTRTTIAENPTRLLWPLLLLGFLVMNCWAGFRQALALQKIARLPRRADFACPSCHASPPAGMFWGCSKCGKGFDIFADGGVCPHCHAPHDMATCVDCGERTGIERWKIPVL